MAANAATVTLQNADFADGLNGWSSRMDGTEVSTVTLDNGPAQTALQVKIKEAPEKPWFVQLRQKIPQKIYPAEKIEITAMMRSPDNVRVALALQLARPPFSPLIYKREDIPSEWSKVTVRGTINEILDSGDGQVVISLGFGTGTIEITDVQVSFPDRDSLDDVPEAFTELSWVDEDLPVINLKSYPLPDNGSLPAGPYHSIIEGLKGFKVQGAEYGKMEMIPVEGQAFNEAVCMTTEKDSPKFYSFQIKQPLVQSVEAGDTLLAVFSYRVAKPNVQTGYGTTQFSIEKIGGKYEKLISWGVSADDTEWHHYVIPFKADFAVAAGGAQLLFRGGYGPQSIDIGGVALINSGQAVTPDSLPASFMDYLGSAPEAPWRKEAAERIEKHRKGDFVLKLTDAQGRPLSGVKVRGKLIRHAYGFGSTLGTPVLLPGTWRYEPKYGEVAAEMFNAGSLENAMKWKQANIPDIDTKIEDGLSWMEGNQWHVRGHTLVWPGWRYNNPDIIALKDDPEALQAAILERIQDVGAKYDGRIQDWDVINEPYTNQDFMQILGDDAMSTWMQAARNAAPHADLYVNDFDIMTRPGSGNPKVAYYEDLIDKFQKEGTPIDGMGLQSHFQGSLTPIPHVYEIIDTFAQKGLKVQLTELTVNIPDEQAQADYVSDFVTIAFSHPATNLVQTWGFWEGYMWEPNAAMFRKDWSPKPLAESFRKLVQETFSTKVDTTTNAEGEIEFRGFFGDYEFTVDGTNKQVEFEADFSDDGENNTEILPL